MAERKSSGARSSATTLRNFALSLPEAEEKTSCNKVAFHAGKKNFFFLGEGEGPDAGAFDGKVKLIDSLAEASELARTEPQHYSVGGTGWVDFEFGQDESPPVELLERWIEESFRALVPKFFSVQLRD